MHESDPAFIVERLQAPAAALRIAVVTETYPPEVNGVAMSLKRMVDGLIAQGHRLQLIRPRQHAQDEALTQPSIQEVLARGLPIPRYANLRLGLPAKQKLVRLWSRERPDVVHLVTEGPLGWSALAAARKLKLPVTSDFRTHFDAYAAHYGMGWLQRPVAAWLRRFHNLSHATFVPTRAMQTQLQASGYRNVAVVSRGVDTRLFHPGRRSDTLRRTWGAGPDTLVVALVSRLAPEKNLDLVAEAFEALRERVPDARMVWVGDGPARAGLQARHPEHVFAGMRNGEDLAAHYASADLFLFASLTETFGNVLTEALASGLPVVTFDQAAGTELIRPGLNGLLAPPGHAPQFIQRVCQLADDPGTRRTMAARAAASVAHLDWDAISRHFSARLAEAVRAQAGPL